MKKNKILLVEGNDDKHVVWALCQQFDIPELFDVEDCNGIDNIMERIPGQFKVHGINSIGIVIDADIDLQARWTSLKNILTTIGFNIPDDLPKEGLIVDNGAQKVGVWIMPDNNTKGMLEDFMSFLIPENDKLLPIVDRNLEEIEKQGLNKYSELHKSKAKIHTWLSWQEDPGTPMGLSITKTYLSTENGLCQQFIDWLKQLFN